MATREVSVNFRFRKQPKGFDGEQLASMLTEAYLKNRRPDGFMQKKSFAPSSIGYGHGTCPRYWYLAFTGGDAIDKTDALGFGNMMHGTSVHQRIEKLFEDAGILIDKEVEFTLQDPPVRGFMDVMIRWDGDVVIGEIKTTRQEAFLHRQATMKPSANHRYQILLYLYATGKKLGFLLYENKNDQTFLVIPVEMNEENKAVLEEALEWMRMVHKSWEDGVVPERPWTKRNKICKACPFFEWCHGDNAPEPTAELPVMEVRKP